MLMTVSTQDNNNTLNYTDSTTCVSVYFLVPSHSKRLFFSVLQYSPSPLICAIIHSMYFVYFLCISIEYTILSKCLFFCFYVAPLFAFLCLFFIKSTLRDTHKNSNVPVLCIICTNGEKNYFNLKISNQNKNRIRGHCSIRDRDTFPPTV